MLVKIVVAEIVKVFGSEASWQDACTSKQLLQDRISYKNISGAKAFTEFKRVVSQCGDFFDQLIASQKQDKLDLVMIERILRGRDREKWRRKLPILNPSEDKYLRQTITFQQSD